MFIVRRITNSTQMAKAAYEELRAACPRKSLIRRLYRLNLQSWLPTEFHKGIFLPNGCTVGG
jgi:hypothetical protein